MHHRVGPGFAGSHRDNFRLAGAATVGSYRLLRVGPHPLGRGVTHLAIAVSAGRASHGGRFGRDHGTFPGG